MLVGLLFTLAIIVFIWTCLGLLAPGLAGLSARWQSVLVWGASVVVLFIGIEMAQPPPPPVITAEQRERNIERQRQQRAEEGISVSEVIAMEAPDRAAAAERQRAEEQRRERQRAARGA